MKVKEITRSTEWIPNPEKTGETPLFSILLSTSRRNPGSTLTRAIQSVLDQTYERFEIIVVDDDSVDGSFDEIQRFMKLDPRIHCLRHSRHLGLPTIGFYEALLKSEGKYLLFCSDENKYQKEALDQVAGYVSTYNPGIAFGYIDRSNEDLLDDKSETYVGKQKISQANLQLTNYLPTLGAILNRDVIDKIGFLDPHLAATKITFGDYWKRIARSYELHHSDIHIGTEFETREEDPNVSGLPLEAWMAYEWTVFDRSKELLLDRYEDYDIQLIPDGLSDQSKLAVLDLLQFYKDKFWYRAPQPLTVAETRDTDAPNPSAKILVLTPSQDASVTLTFEHIREATQIIRYVSPAFFDSREIINASALIVSRQLFSPEVHHWLQVARQLDIPHYYYLDDNFMILSGELPEFRDYTSPNMTKELASFRAVLVPSSNLANYFLEQKLHSRVFLFPPAISSDRWLDYSAIPAKPIGTTRIGFLGGLHRRSDFVEIVLPAIRKLAVDYPVELVVGGDHIPSTDESSALTIYQFPFDTSYRLAIGRMKSANIDILVHAGSITRNNPYKTQNALLNADALQAVPVLLSQPPYEDIEHLELAFLCEENNIEEWHNNLQRAITDSDLVTRMRTNLHQYVMQNYSGKQNLDVLKTISNECYTSGVSLLDQRYRKYLKIVEGEKRLSAFWNPAQARGRAKLVAILQLNRSWLLPARSYQERLARWLLRAYYFLQRDQAFGAGNRNPLMAQGSVRLIKKLEYRLRPQAQHWNGFEFMIGTHQKKASGYIQIEIKEEPSGAILRQQALDLIKIHDNQIVKVNFDTILDSKDKDFRVSFSLQTKDEETSISIYEKNKTETKIHRVLRNWGLLTWGNTLACRLLYGDTTALHK